MIDTERLRLIPCQPSYLRALAKSKDDLGKALQVAVAAGWPQFPEAYKPPAENTPELPGYNWGTILFILKNEACLIGSGGFKGKPDDSGVVELGYEIAPEYWNRGYGSEAVRGMLNYALADKSVKRVTAHTLGEENASNKVLKKIGMRFLLEITDPEHGKIWQWGLDKSPT